MPQGEPLPHRQALLLQRSAVAGSQEPQVLPPAPQAVIVFPGWQVPPMQQPVGQLVASQTQEPPTQR